MNGYTYLGMVGVGALLAAHAATGCGRLSDDCQFMLECVEYPPLASGGGGTSSSSGVGGDGGGGGSQGNCDPEAGSVDEGCGVFASVSLGAAGASGTKMAPLASLAAAVAAAGELKRVYACAEVFAESVTVSEGVTIYGGLDCAGGSWAALADEKTTVQGSAEEVALRVENTANGAKVYDLAVRAADATVPGGSSIAVLVDGATATLLGEGARRARSRSTRVPGLVDAVRGWRPGRGRRG